MKNPVLTSFNSDVTTCLKPLIDHLVKTSSPSAVQKRSLMINDIPAGFYFTADKGLVSQTLESILTTFITYAGDSCIRISAEKLAGNMVQVNMRDNNNNNSYALACALQKIVPLVEKTGGHLNIINRKQKITTISFIFQEPKEGQVYLKDLRGAA